MTKNQQMDLCFYGGIVIAMIIVLCGFFVTLIFEKPWILLVSGAIAIVLSFIFVEVVDKFVKVD